MTEHRASRRKRRHDGTPDEKSAVHIPSRDNAWDDWGSVRKAHTAPEGSTPRNPTPPKEKSSVKKPARGESRHTDTESGAGRGRHRSNQDT
jgi:hypothetical protein